MELVDPHDKRGFWNAYIGESYNEEVLFYRAK